MILVSLSLQRNYMVCSESTFLRFFFVFGSWQHAAFGGMGNGRLIVGRGCPFGF